MSALKVEIEEKREVIKELEVKVAEVKADTAASLHAVNVQTRYASRVQGIVRATPPFLEAMGTLIQADKAALAAKGK